MWAAVRLSLVSFGVCNWFTSILKIVAVNVIAVWASFRTKKAKPTGSGRGWPPGLVVGGLSDGSWVVVRLAKKRVLAELTRGRPKSTSARARAIRTRGDMQGLLVHPGEVAG